MYMRVSGQRQEVGRSMVYRSDLYNSFWNYRSTEADWSILWAYMLDGKKQMGLVVHKIREVISKMKKLEGIKQPVLETNFE